MSVSLNGFNEVFESTNINLAPARCKALFWESEAPESFCLLCHLVEEDRPLYAKGMAEWKMVVNKKQVLWTYGESGLMPVMGIKSGERHQGQLQRMKNI